MSATDDSLGRCVGDVDAFVSQSWGRRPLLHRGDDGEEFADLLTVADVDELVAARGLRTPHFRLVKDGETIPASRYTRRATIGSQPVTDLADPGKVFALFDEGATVVLQGLQRLSGPLARFCRDLELTLTHPVQANAYLTPAGAAGLASHVDAHDVFALQTHGRKQWVVGAADEARDLELVAGDCLYLPAGTTHAARSVGSPSLHVTIGVQTLSWKDVEREALDLVTGSADTARLPVGFAADPDFPQAVGARLRALADRVEALDAGDVAERTARRFWGRRRPLLEGQLSQLLALDGVGDDTVLRRRRGTVATLDVSGDEATLVLGDRTLVLPARAAPAVRRLLDEEELAVGQLADLLDERSRAVLARRLVREGLLSVAGRG